MISFLHELILMQCVYLNETFGNSSDHKFHIWSLFGVHELISHGCSRDLYEKRFCHKFHIWILSFLHELMVCDGSCYSYNRSGKQKFHITVGFFFHELMLCDSSCISCNNNCGHKYCTYNLTFFLHELNVTFQITFVGIIFGTKFTFSWL